jgi:exopolysaccharide production protein ExoZ
MYFYLIFAVLLLAPRRAVRPLLVCWFVLQLLCCALLRDSGGAAATFFKNPIAVEFIFGIIVGILYEHNVFPAPRAAFWTASGVCLVLWLASDRLGDMPGIERIFIWGVPAACLVYGVIGIERVRYAVSPASLVSLGDASYALYLWHLPVLILLGQVAVAIHLQGAVVHGVLVIGMLAAVIVFSLGMYRYAERPLTQYLSGLLERNARQSKVIAEIHDLTIIKRQSHEVN